MHLGDQSLQYCSTNMRILLVERAGLQGLPVSSYLGMPETCPEGSDREPM